MNKTIHQEVRICDESVSEIGGLIDNVIKHFKERKSQFKNEGYTDIKVEFEDKWGYYDEHWIEAVYYGTEHLTAEEFLKKNKKKKNEICKTHR